MLLAPEPYSLLWCFTLRVVGSISVLDRLDLAVQNNSLLDADLVRELLGWTPL